jgi:D-aminopeptidase
MSAPPAGKTTPLKNLITDVPGLRVGAADDARIASGVSVVLFDEPAAAGIATFGGAPALRDGALLAPEMTMDKIDALVLSGGSAFGLDASGGVMAYLAALGRGFAKDEARVPICPGASLFDLTHGGDKKWGRRSPYGDLGHAAVEAAGLDFALGTVGAGHGAWTCDLKGGLGSASAVTSGGFVVGALVAVNAAGRATRGSSPHFWAASHEREAEFGGLGEGPRADDAFRLALSGDEPGSTTLAVVATDAAFDKARMTRIAIMASGGIALALRPAFGPADGDIVFAGSTARAPQPPSLRDLTEIGMLAAECVARAIARGVFEATALPFPGAKPSWKDKYGARLA